jgi:myosin-crossreactive antigen
MKKAIAIAFLFVLATVAAASSQTETGTWTGIVTDTHCGEEGAAANHAECAKKCIKKDGASWALWDPKAKQLYELVNAKDAEKMAGTEVTVKGTLTKADKKIDVTSIEAAKK